MVDQSSRLACLRVTFHAPNGLHPRVDPNYLLLAALYQAINRHPGLDGKLKARLHEAQPMPFTISPLFLAEQRGTAVSLADTLTAPAGGRLWIRLCTLNTEALAALLKVFVRSREGHPLRLDFDELRVVGWAPFPHAAAPRDGITTYRRLLDNARAARQLSLRLSSPFTVRSGARSVPPTELTARHFFGAYLRQWQTFSPGEMAHLSIDQLLAAVDLLPPDELHPAPEPALPSKAPRDAYLGHVTFRVTGDPSLRPRIAALADYAWYCGTGAATAWGRGQTERIV